MGACIIFHRFSFVLYIALRNDTRVGLPPRGVRRKEIYRVLHRRFRHYHGRVDDDEEESTVRYRPRSDIGDQNVDAKE